MPAQKASTGVENDTRVENVAINIVVTFAKKRIDGIWFIGMAVKSPDDIDNDKGVKVAERRLCEAITRYKQESQNKAFRAQRPHSVMGWPRQEYLSSKTMLGLAKKCIETSMEAV